MHHMSKVITLLLVLACLSAAGKEHTAQLLARETYKLNSGGRPDGRSRVVLPVNLPPGTVAVFYTVQTSHKQAPGFIDLAAKVAMAIRNNPIKTTVNLLGICENIRGTVGDGVADVYYLDADNVPGFSAKRQFNYQPDYSRLNYTTGTVGIPVDFSFTPTPIYIGLRNPSALQAVEVTIEVAVIVRK